MAPKNKMNHAERITVPKKHTTKNTSENAALIDF